MLNPITYSEKVVSDFLRYQLTTYPLADPLLYKQLRALLSLEHTRNTPLLRGPYVSLSRSFRAGKKVSQLVAEKLLHPHIQALSPYPNVYGHQETAFRAIANEKTTLVSTGTGSGKTECFLYPIISHCLKLRDEGAPEGISAVLVYPMNALAEDQLGRLRSLLTGSGVTFGMYVGKTPEKAADVAGHRLDARASRGDYEAAVRRMREEKRHQPVLPPEERASREEMRERGKRPRILLTNVKQLELLLTRQRDVELFDGARLEFLVFDEAHTFSGAAGAETACLIRRLRSFCGKTPEQTVCIATSATIADPERGAEAGREFASRFFGVREENVALVGEEYEKDVWAEKRTVSGPLPGNPAIQLQTVLEAVRGVEKDTPTPQDLQILKTAFQAMTGSSLDVRRWQESLHERLAANEVVYQIAEALKIAKPLSDLVNELEARFGRAVPEEEIVAWLALGAASRCEGRPLLRPVVHGFIRGLGGAVVSFPRDLRGPKLWLSREDAAIGEAEGEKLVHLDLTTCTTCGQHYFAHFVADFTFFARAPGGGEAVEDRVVWRPLEAKAGGQRVVLLDRLISADDEADDADEPRNTASVYLCRRCGALHPGPIERCDGCGERGALVALFAVQQKEPTEKEGSEKVGKLTVCVSCRAQGRSKPGGYREPARPVRAQNVSDVHVLAQSMLQHSERPRLLIFTDNRQDAAFQAGWMQDHARRFRLRSLMYEQIVKGPISVGDLTGALDDLLEPDDDLSQALIPEVWRAERKETSGIRHSAERKRFLRIQVLREIVTGARQRLGLEPWGRMMVEYDGLTPDLAFFQTWASRIGCAAEALRDGVATLLDLNRRAAILYDRDLRLYSRFWPDGAKEIQRGYFPAMPGGPKGLKLRRAANDEPSRVKQLMSARGATTARLLARRWGLADDQLEPFFDDLWKLLTGPLALLVPVNLTGWNEKVLPGCSEVTQLDADRLRLAAHHGVYRCALCRRTNLRPTPKMACTGRSCAGTLTLELENADNYDLMVLDQRFVMIRPREHSAQIPADEREILERAFKGDSQLTNTLVCTPTLELGVDIGALDSVLMRNVPPLPANYWQRAGRAGRRHRMAVNLTYARSASHDRAYFADPLKLLHGLVQPPRFNLKNEPMVRKHVHATMLTVLHRLASTTAVRDAHQGGREALSLADREAIAFALEQCIPTQIKTYLFDAADNVRTSAFDVGALARVISRHEAWLLHEVKAAFTQEWPAKDSAVVEPDVLRATIASMAEGLAEVIARLEQRLRWALDQMRRLDSVRAHKGTLDPDEDALRARCDRLIKRYKGQQSRARRDAEGYDDTYTYAVLAAEGFLPGYGLDVGTVVGFHQAARYGTGMRDWELRRALPLAVREYVPGNLIYANGHRFLPRFYHLVALEEPTLFQVDITNSAVSEAGLGADAAVVGLGATALVAVPICDVDLPHQSHISDEEDYRFQLPVTVYGYEQPRHGGGKAFAWGERVITCRTSVHLRLVNVGPTSGVRDGHLGYPLCLVCGQSRSPLASKKDKEAFSTDHHQRCGRPVTQVGFYADVIADALAIDGCADLTEAYSVAEALRKGAAEVLEIELGDLQLLVVGRAGEQERKVLIYDPMPGGSGLLDQLVARWAEIVREAHDLLVSCRSACATACVDCLLNYRNSFYHAHLDRHVAARLLESRGGTLMVTHDIPPLLPLHLGTGQPVNQAESSLRYMLERAGFHNARPQHAIDLGKPLGVTTPDFFFDDSSERTDGICLYLDGMSQALHGNPATQMRDRAIREELRNRSYEVLEITYGQLSDQAAMREKFWRLARMLMGKDRASKIRDDASWFEEAVARHASDHPPPSLGSGWNEILALLDEAWIPLAMGLRDARVPVPDDAHDDILVDGRVSEHKAILMWAQAAPFVALIDSELTLDEKHGRLLRVSADSDPREVAAALIERLGGGR